jgi:uncharacterized RDD family membrane protein YckC
MTNITTHPETGKRIGATLIDYGVIFTFFFFYIYGFGEPNEEGGYTVNGLPALVPFGFWFLYLVVIEYNFGATLGHAIFQLTVTTMQHGKPSFGQILKRRIADVFDISMSFGIVAMILVLNSRYNQRLGDIWAKTLVVNKQKIGEDIRHFEFEDDNWHHVTND